MRIIKACVKVVAMALCCCLLTAAAHGQHTMRRDVLLMIDSIEMAYAQACPEIPVKTVSTEEYTNDVAAITAVNSVYDDSMPFSRYKQYLLAHGFYQGAMANDTTPAKRISFYYKRKGNITISLDVSFLKDSITGKLVRIETGTHPYCLTKNKLPQIYWIDIYYIHRFVSLIHFPFKVTMAEATDTKEHWDEVKP